MAHVYDYIIIGAGLSGLYCAHYLKNKGHKLLVLEKGGRLGGRIKTINMELPQNGKQYTYEAGAQRFSYRHKRLLKLINQLGLTKHIYPLNNKIDNIMSNNYENNNPVDLINKLIAKTKNTTIKYKKSNTLQAIGEDLIGTQFVRNTIDCMGYDAGPTKENFCDFERTYKDETDFNYYSLHGGLVSICNILAQNIDVKYSIYIIDYEYKNNHFVVKTNQETYLSKKLILAIPKSALLKIPKLSDIESQLNSVTDNSYIRIYAIYPPDSKGNYWFKGINKTITDGHIRQVIPDESQYTGNQGLIQICYCDENHANIWFNYASAGLLKQVIHKHLKKLFPDREIPEPLYIKSHYTPEGTHFWKPNNHSSDYYEFLLKPFDYPLYICGETYSHYQGWMEGALETAEDVIKISQN